MSTYGSHPDLPAAAVKALLPAAACRDCVYRARTGARMGPERLGSVCPRCGLSFAALVQARAAALALSKQLRCNRKCDRMKPAAWILVLLLWPPSTLSAQPRHVSRIVSSHAPLSPADAVAVLAAGHSTRNIANRAQFGPGPLIVIFGTPGSIAPWDWPANAYDPIAPLSNQPWFYYGSPWLPYGPGAYRDTSLVTLDPTWTMHAPRGLPTHVRRPR